MVTGEKWLDGAEQAAWRGWLDTYRLLIPVLDRQLQSVSPASFTDYEVLVRLSEAAGRRLRMSQVADRTLATRSAVTRTIDRLVGRGWVRRVKAGEDQRGSYAELTQLGADTLAQLAPGHVRAVRENLIDLLRPEELAALTGIGARVRVRLAAGTGLAGDGPTPAGDGPTPAGDGPNRRVPVDRAAVAGPRHESRDESPARGFHQ